MNALTTGGDIRPLLTNSAGTTAEFKIATSMKYWIWGCTEDNQPLSGQCESGLWDFVIQKSYLEVACDGRTLLHFEFAKAPVDNPTICTNMWNVDFVSFKFHADTATEKYRLIDIPGKDDGVDPTQSTDIGKLLQHRYKLIYTLLGELHVALNPIMCELNHKAVI